MFLGVKFVNIITCMSGDSTAILMMSRGGFLQGSLVVKGISEADWKQ